MEQEIGFKTKQKLSKTAISIAIAISVLFLFFSISAALTQDTFVDEPAHIVGGYTKLKFADYRMNSEAPPLGNMISSFPLLFTNLKNFTNDSTWIDKDMNTYGNIFLNQNNLSETNILFLARLPTILLGLLLGLFIFYFVSKKYGDKVGIIVYFLYATHPMILTHMSIVYTDFIFMFMNFFTFIVFLEFIRTKKSNYLYLFMVLFSLTFLTKFTSLHNFILYPIIILLNLKRLKSWFVETYKNKKLLKYILLFIVIIYLLILVIYQFQTVFVPLKESFANDPHLLETDHKYAKAQELFKNNPVGKVISSVPNPLPYYFTKGVGYWVFDTRTKGGNLNIGQTIKNLLLKNTLSIIILIGVLGYMWIKSKSKKFFNFYEKNFIYYILFYFLMFGILGSYVYPRYLLMVYPFILLLIAKAIKSLCNNSKNNKWLIIIIAFILLIHILSVISYYPDFYRFSSILKYLFGPAYNDLPFFAEWLVA